MIWVAIVLWNFCFTHADMLVCEVMMDLKTTVLDNNIPVIHDGLFSIL